MGDGTVENLKAALAGESQANRTYLAFAKKAEEEGHLQAAKLFRAAAEAETIHAMTYLELLGRIKGTEENLKAAMAGETHEYTTMYPGFVETAKKEGESKAATAFSWALKAEEGHANLYRAALENLGKEPGPDYYVCQTCGWTSEGEAPERCPVCGRPKEQFKRIG
ncbi:MAG: rubrerythrin family protein [Methanobacteriota archaeon]|nr:MAG: rubrerythrin family protein [Euryarchaeota archaeon]